MQKELSSCIDDSSCKVGQGCIDGLCRTTFGMCPSNEDCECKSSALTCHRQKCFCKVWKNPRGKSANSNILSLINSPCMKPFWHFVPDHYQSLGQARVAFVRKSLQFGRRLPVEVHAMSTSSLPCGQLSTSRTAKNCLFSTTLLF